VNPILSSLLYKKSQINLIIKKTPAYFVWMLPKPCMLQFLSQIMKDLAKKFNSTYTPILHKSFRFGGFFGYKNLFFKLFHRIINYKRNIEVKKIDKLIGNNSK
jgi:hypothetical protein